MSIALEKKLRCDVRHGLKDVVEIVGDATWEYWSGRRIENLIERLAEELSWSIRILAIRQAPK